MRAKSRATSRRSQNKRSLRWLLRLIWIVVIIVSYYFVFALFFDTPLEHELKKSNQKLTVEYRTLSQRYDSIQSVLDNIIKRDKGISHMLFESDPYSSWEDSTNVNNSHINNDLSNLELGDQLILRTGLIYQRIYSQDSKMESTLKLIHEKRALINSTPAIQPIDNPHLTLLTASFGERIHPFYKTMKQHNGFDYSIPSGTAVFATADGMVIEIQTRGQSTGISLVIDHGNGYKTFYANLGRALAQVGQRVNRGDIIAFSGNSGMSFAPHLHYEIRYKGKAVDPINYLFLEVGIHRQKKLKRIAAAGMQSFD